MACRTRSTACSQCNWPGARAGNSPVQIHKEQLEELVPLWYDLALKFHQDAAATKAFGWIQEASTSRWLELFMTVAQQML